MEDLKQQYLYKMKSLINEFPIKDYRDEKIDIKINELKENFNGMSIEINIKKKLQQLEQIFSDLNDDCTSSDDDSFENIDYIEASPPDSELVSLEEVKDDILHEKLLNIYLLIAKIESLNDNPTPDCVLKSPSTFPILVEDNDSFFKKSDTSLSYSDNSLPEFETFSDHTRN
ncbi:hypothetical protein Tco_1209832 [Tanacetum coccineum]